MYPEHDYQHTLGAEIGGSFNPGGASVGAGLGGSFSGRDVTVKVTIDPTPDWQQYIPLIGFAATAYQNYNVTGEIERYLAAAGWSVRRVTDVGYSVGAGRQFEITAGVSSSYSDGDIVREMRSDLLNVGEIHSIAIVRQGSTQYVNPTASGDANVGSTVRLTGGGLSSNLLGGLGLGLGLSTPVVLGAAAILLIIVMRR